MEVVAGVEMEREWRELWIGVIRKRIRARRCFPLLLLSLQQELTLLERVAVIICFCCKWRFPLSCL